jgi:hypothetical protein
MYHLRMDNSPVSGRSSTETWSHPVTRITTDRPLVFTDGRKRKLGCCVGCLPAQYRLDNKKSILLKMEKDQICLAFPLFSLFNNSY